MRYPSISSRDGPTVFTSYSLDQLTMFLAVVDEGSFSAAGRRLGRVQSAVSTGIARLETAVGVRLFDRRGRQPKLTAAGRQIAAEARLVIARAQALTETASRLQSDIEPQLRIVVDALYPGEQLVEACAELRERFPTTALRVETGLLGDAVQSVLEGRSDLGACNLDGTLREPLTASHLGIVRVVPVCAPHHPLARTPGRQPASALEPHVQIVQTELRPATRDRGVIGTRTWRVSSQELKVALIRRGLGWGSLPATVVAPLLEAGELVALAPEPWPDGGHVISLHAVVLRERPLGRAGQWLRQRLVLDR